MKYLRAILAIAFFVFFVKADFHLLMSKVLKSQEAIGLFMGVSILSLVIYLLPEVQELSLGGQVLKLKQAKQEVDETINTLKKIQISTYTASIRLSMKNPGGLGSSFSKIDPRANDLFFLYEDIKKNGLLNDMKKELHSLSEVILAGQKAIILNFSNIPFDEITTSTSLQDDVLSKAKDDKKETLVSIIEATSNYKKIHDIFDDTKED